MPTQRKSAKSSRKSSSKSTGSSSKKSASQSRSRAGSSGSRASQSRSGARAKSQGSSRSRSQGTSRSSATKRSSARRGKTPNALELLTEDHRNVQKMFRKAERLESGDRQLQEIVETACAALTQHAEIEEQLFYPALQEQGNDQDLVQEALVEHDSAKQLIAQLESMDAGDERYKATFKVLGEYVNHHIEEEESRIFREARRAKIDMEALGEQILMIKQSSEAMDDTGEGQASTSGRRGGSSAKRSSSRNEPASPSSGSRGRSGSSRASSTARQGSSAGDSRSSGESDSQNALDDDSESTTAMSRTGGDSGEDTERPGRGGRRARSAGNEVDDDEIDVETPGSSHFESH